MLGWECSGLDVLLASGALCHGCAGPVAGHLLLVASQLAAWLSVYASTTACARIQRRA